jgi:CheY-like chemotaxis protein
MNIAYLFISHDFGLEPLLRLLGVKSVNKVSSSDKEKVTKEILKANAKDSLLIFFDDEEGIGLLEEFRLVHSISSPSLLLSFSTQDKVEKRFTISPKTNKPIITFRKGTYYLQLPFRIDKLRGILKEAAPVNKTEMNNIKAEYEFAIRYKEDADFRHRCANLASAIRILQGAYYVGDVRKEDYLSTLESLRQLSWKTPELRAYAKTIKDYMDNFSAITQSPSPEDDESKSFMSAKLMLLDDEAETAGWDIVLKTIFDKQGFSLATATDRERFLSDIESKGELDFDVLLLDLKMPDSPERSIHLIERMSDRHPGIPIVVFSALTDLPYFRKCQEAGAFNYFAKELGSEDRNPERYYKKLKETLSSAVKFRASYIKKDKKGQTFKTEGAPYLNTLKIDNKWITRFAYKVEAVKGAAPNSAAEETNRLKDIQNRFLSWLYRQPSDGRAVSLRLMCFPEGKRVELIFIGKTTGNTANESQEKANIFSKDLWSFLKPFHPTYRFIPLSSEKEFLSLIDAIEPQNIINIMRERFEIKPNRKDFFEWFYPFTTNPNSTLLATIEKMLAMKEPVFIGLTLMPHEFKAVILDKIKELNQIKNASWKKPSTEEIGFSKNPTKRVQEERPESLTLDFLTPEEMGEIFNNIDKELKSMKEGCFIYHFFAASDDTMPTFLLENIRYDYFGPEGNIGFNDAKDQRDIMAHSIKYLDIPTLRNKDFSPTPNLIDSHQASALFRLPFPNTDGIKGIEEDRAKIVELPRQYPKTVNKEAFLLAEGFRDNRIESVCIQEKDLDKHLYICGKTGSGKSTLILRLILSVIEKGKGVCLIDPHEDLVEMALERVPESRVNDVIWFNPRDAEKPIGINLLENDGSEEQQDMIVQEFTVMVFKMFSAESMGPMFERSMRYTLLLLMANNLTLADFARPWEDKDFRKKCLEKLNPSLERHKNIITFWENEMPRWKGDDMSNFSTYVISKFDRMNTSKIMRTILGASKSTIDIKEIMDGNKILLISLPRGLIGEVNANLLGMIISTKIRISTLSRASMSAKDRTPFYLFIDEFQNFVSTSGLSYSKGGYDETFTSMLSEARKYNISLILANQYLEQLGEGIKKALFGNIGSLIAFKAGVEDSKYLHEHFANKLNADDFRTIPSYHAYANLLLDGDSLPPFTIRTIPMENISASNKRKTAIIKRTREKYGIKSGVD